jgi:hypothetical protein
VGDEVRSQQRILIQPCERLAERWERWSVTFGERRQDMKDVDKKLGNSLGHR